MKILITGICGFVGSTLARGLRTWREGVELCGIDNFSRQGSRSNLDSLRADGIRVNPGDIRRPEDLEQFGAVDWVIDAAANPSVLAGVDGKTGPAEVLDHNLVGTIPVLELCRRHSATFTLLSTSRVYNIPGLLGLAMTTKDDAFHPDTTSLAGISARGISEQFSVEPPVSLYGVSKRCAELLALEYAGAFGIPVWINRCGVLAGAGQFGKPDQGIYSYWIHSWNQQRPLKYLGFGGTGRQTRDCLHPRDLLPLLWRQFDHGPGADKPRLCNVSGGMSSATSLAQLSAWCRSHAGAHDVVADGSDRPYDLPWVVLDSGLAAEVWGWQPATSAADIFVEILEHARQHPEWLALSGA